MSFCVYPDDGQFARRARRGVDLDHVALGRGVEPERVCFAQIVFDGERQFAQIRNRPDVRRRELRLIHFCTVRLAVFIYVLHRLSEPFALQRLHLRARKALVFGLIDVIFDFALSCHWSPHLLDNSTESIFPPPHRQRRVFLFIPRSRGGVAERERLFVHFNGLLRDARQQRRFKFFAVEPEPPAQRAEHDGRSPPWHCPLRAQARARRCPHSRGRFQCPQGTAPRP